ncbi:hypothetical protein GCM10010293_01560 [Streptomyces griseoflavus]|nr:hypothetical protein GCM10010293_01560 [Streptomyces griseoflavus]
MPQQAPAAQQSPRAQHWHWVRSWARKARTSFGGEPAELRMDVLADALEDALAQTQELREQLDRLEAQHTHD